MSLWIMRTIRRRSMFPKNNDRCGRCFFRDSFQTIDREGGTYPMGVYFCLHPDNLDKHTRKHRLVRWDTQGCRHWKLDGEV